MCCLVAARRSLIAAPLAQVARAAGAATVRAELALDRHAADRSGGADRAGCPTACATSSARTRGRPSACRCGWPSTSARSRRSPISAGSRTSSSTWRSTAPRTSSRASWSRSSSRSARASARTSTPRRRSTRPSTCSTCPTDRAGYVDRGLLVLHDFAAGMSLLPAEVEKERGVVLEEWRGRLGAGSRLTDKQLPVIFQGSRYAERLPIGTPEVLKSAPRERLLAFYQKWYRPDQMAVVVVGDIDPAEAEAARAEALRRHSGGEGRRPPPSTAACRRTRRRCISMVDRSGSAGLVGVGRRSRARPKHDDTVGGLSRDAGAAAGDADAEPAAARDRAAAERAVPRRRRRARAALAARSSCSRSKRAVPEGGSPQGLEALMVEAGACSSSASATRSSIAPGGAAGRLRARLQRARHHRRARATPNEYVRALPRAGADSRDRVRIPDRVDLSADGHRSRKWRRSPRNLITDENRVVLGVAPEKKDVPVPTETALRAAMARAERGAGGGVGRRDRGSRRWSRSRRRPAR